MNNVSGFNVGAAKFGSGFGAAKMDFSAKPVGNTVTNFMKGSGDNKYAGLF